MENSSPFEQAKNCFTKQEHVDSQSNGSANYMLARALSMSREGFVAASMVNEAAVDCPKWAVRMLAHVSVPPGRAPYGTYIKKPKSPLTEKEKIVVKQLEKFYNITPVHAIQVFAILKVKKVDFDALFGQTLKNKK